MNENQRLFNFKSCDVELFLGVHDLRLRILSLSIELFQIRGFPSNKSLPSSGKLEQFIDVTAQTETIKNTIIDDDNQEEFKNIVDEAVSTLNPALEVLNFSFWSMVLENVAHPEFLTFLK